MEFDKDHCIRMNDGNKIPAVGFGTYSPDAVSKSFMDFFVLNLLINIAGHGYNHYL